jgi:hypothetical protein
LGGAAGPVSLRIHCEIEVIRRRSVAFAQELRQPWTEGDAVKAGTISILRSFDVVFVARIKGRLKVLHQIIAAAGLWQLTQNLRGRPKGGEDAIRRRDCSFPFVVLRGRGAEMFPNIFANLLGAVVIHQTIRHHVNPAFVSKLGEQADDAKDSYVATGSWKWLRHEPVNHQPGPSTSPKPASQAGEHA